mmetsp:Transcript_5833/g.7210  ORF Transcript_5833/g.7210 Transcript_5833/m.7210 type:complete len:256 (+) Transcript_5833:52-819(+)
MSLKVLVPIKRVIDYTVKIRIASSMLGIEKKNVKMSMNPFCEIALEEAVRLKEQNIANEIIAVTIGNKKCSEQLRTAMAMGADKAIHVLTDMEIDTELQPFGVSNILQYIINKENPNLVLLGKQSIDDDCNQTGQMLAGKLQWPQCTFASKIEFKNDNQCEVLREIDGGLQRVKMTLPGIITADLRLNEPRFATLQNIMKARKKVIEEIKLDDINIDIKPRIEYESINDPPIRKGGVFVDDVQMLFDKLKDNAII